MNANNQNILNAVENTGEAEVMVFAADKPPAFNLANGMGVLRAIHKIQRAILEFGGIAKTHDTKSNNASFQYKFRSIEDMYNVITPLLVDSGVILIPYLVNGRMTKHTSKKGDVSFKTVVVMRYTLYCTEDGSFIESCMVGESNDSGDKSSTKAQSVAQKAFFIQTFAIPTANITDNRHSHEPVPSHQDQYHQQQHSGNQYDNRNNAPQHQPQHQQPQRAPQVRYASLQFKNQVDEYMRQYDTALCDALNRRNMDMNTITEQELHQIVADFDVYLSKKKRPPEKQVN